MQHHLALNIDEIAPNIESAISFLNRNKIDVVELRTINGKNIANFSNDEIVRLRDSLESYDLQVCAIASPLFKWYKKAPDNPEFFESFGFPCIINDNQKAIAIDQVIEHAKLLNVDKVRIFSELRTGEADINEVILDPLFQSAINKAKDNNIKILLENEPICQVYKLKDVNKVLQEKKDIGLWLDVSNFYQTGEKIEIDDIYKLLPYIHHVHLKDFIFNKDNNIEHVPLGEGCIPWKDILSFIYKEAKHPISMSIETHVIQNKFDAIEKSINFYRKTLQL